ncbi:DUF6624 domain-containing protein [Undibacterium terreum]|uniref:Uncharacterized protein n=1 Tax=Undibacterium terreum TaxID=1224302 RepID=A0A916UBK1_9BURK|nr:DUF6624 domain-containing protein [Undibacterium terreum]GGC66910.1 hypothetical protein GCM10011396_12410 [Undibacterium terreum]
MLALLGAFFISTANAQTPVAAISGAPKEAASAPNKTACDWYAEVKRTNTWFQRDQAVREPIGRLHQQAYERGEVVDPVLIKQLEQTMTDTDRLLQAELDDLVRRCGWPTTTEFGDKAPQYAAMLVQHAELEYQLRYFPLMKAAVDSNELPGRFLATLEDRIRMRQGLPQIYGTQIVGGKDKPAELQLWPVEDEDHLDERRAKAGMVPVSICAYLGLIGPKVSYARCAL